MASIPNVHTYKAPLPRISRRTALIRTALLSMAVAIVLFGVLTLQMALGSDPAIGAGANGTPSNAAAAVTKATVPTPQVAAPLTLTPTPAPTIPTPTPMQTTVS